MSLFRFLVLSLALVPALSGAAPPSEPRPTPLTSGMVQGSGVRLHYLDFGGHGPPVLLLAGMSNTAWIYSEFGSDLARRHRVWALTRRGHGESEQPATGYSLDDFSNDILAFLDARKIDRVILVGHSMAGAELTHFASQHPARVAALVYLDAAYDRAHQKTMPEEPNYLPKMAAADKASAQAFLAYVRRTRPDLRRYWSEAVERDLRASVGLRADGSYGWKIGPIYMEYLKAASVAPPKYDKITAPALAIYSVEDESYRAPPGSTVAQKAAVVAYAEGPIRLWREKSLDQFAAGPGVREVAQIDGGHHLFLHRPEETLWRIEGFLARNGLASWP